MPNSLLPQFDERRNDAIRRILWGMPDSGSVKLSTLKQMVIAAFDGGCLAGISAAIEKSENDKETIRELLGPAPTVKGN